MRTNIAGFNVKPECYDEIYNLLKNPIIIPSQTLDRRPFASAASASGIEANIDISLSNATNITVT